MMIHTAAKNRNISFPSGPECYKSWKFINDEFLNLLVTVFENECHFLRKVKAIFSKIFAKTFRKFSLSKLQFLI